MHRMPTCRLLFPQRQVSFKWLPPTGRVVSVDMTSCWNRKIQGTQDRAFILEFKVFNSRREKNLEDTVASALEQIDKKQYEADLVARGIPAENIRKYGFAFEGKKVLIG